MTDTMREHVTQNGRFQSDRFPTTPEGKIPLSDRQPDALQPLLLYAARHVCANVHGDTQIAYDLVHALMRQHGPHKVTAAAKDLDILADDQPETIDALEDLVRIERENIFRMHEKGSDQ